LVLRRDTEGVEEFIRVRTSRQADSGIELTLESLIPEITVTADGVYWHSVSADHDDQLWTRDIFPLQDTITEVLRLFTLLRARSTAAA
jgi:hypothetical protein